MWPGKITCFPDLRALAMYTRQGDLHTAQGKPRASYVMTHDKRYVSRLRNLNIILIDLNMVALKQLNKYIFSKQKVSRLYIKSRKYFDESSVAIIPYKF